jgi:hypothetical protein
MVRPIGCLGLGLGCQLLTTVALAQAPTSGNFPAEETAKAAPSPQQEGPAPAATSAAPAPTSAEPPASTTPPMKAEATLEESKPPPVVEDTDAPKYRGQFLSFTFSPFHLLLPMFELQGELMVVPHFGVSLIGGIGNLKANASTSSGVVEHKFMAYELGTQLVGYPLDAFGGLQLGAELMYIRVNSTTLYGEEIEATAGGASFGPLVGYKLLTKVGFTLVVQGGVQYMFARGYASDSQGNSASAEASAFGPLLNFNIGWSF